MSKKNLILGGVLIILIAFAWLWSGPLKDWQQQAGEEKNFLAGITAAQVEKIEIGQNGQMIVLERSNSGWKVAGFKDFFVNREVAANLNMALDKMGGEKIEVASTASAKKTSFGTGSAALQVKFTGANPDLVLEIGSNSADYAGTYISRPDDDKTYLINLDLKGIFGREEWRDQTIFSFLKERAAKVRFQYGKANFIAEKKDNKWAGTEPWKFPVSEEKITAVLSILENLSAAKIPAQDFKGTGLEKNNQIIQVTGEGLDNTLMVGDCTKDNLCYAKTAANDNIYLITKANRDALNKKIADLK